MADKRTRASIAVATAGLTGVTWLALSIGAAPSASAHHGTAIGKGGTVTPPPAAAKPAPAPSPAPAPAPTQAAQPAQATISGTLDIGSSGDAVRAVEQRLDSLRYWIPNVDSNYDEDTYQAVMAFQKANNLDRTGTVNQSVWSAMQSATEPSALVPDGGSHRVEIDLKRQVLFLYEGGKLSKVFPVSSGTSATPTPTGDYRIYSQSTGWETSRLGRLYNSQYFVGGYAIHGSLSVPNYPASHGCVRLTMSAADWFPNHVSLGTPVYVR